MKVRRRSVSFSKQPISMAAMSATQTPFNGRPFSSRHPGRNPFLRIPIAQRLTLGFLLAALIAAVAAGAVGVGHVQSLNKETSFYQDLLRTNTDLTTGAAYLQLMNAKLHETLTTALEPAPSQETLVFNQKALRDLATRYDMILTNYTQHDLISQRPNQMTLLTEAGNEEQA